MAPTGAPPPPPPPEELVVGPGVSVVVVLEVDEVEDLEVVLLVVAV
jgi:hypothetical protein